MSDESNEAPGIIVVRKQQLGSDGKWYSEHNDRQEDFSLYLSGATQGSSKIGTVPTGKKFHCQTIIFHNLANIKCEVVLTNGSGVSFTKMKFMAASYASHELMNVKGLVFDDDCPYWQLNTLVTASSMFLGGYLDADEDAS